MKKTLLVLLLILFLTGCNSSMQTDAKNETYTDPEQVIKAIDLASKNKFKNYVLLDLRVNPEAPFINGFQKEITNLDQALEDMPFYSFIVVFSHSTELSFERASYIESLGYYNVKVVNIPVEQLLEHLESKGYTHTGSCPLQGC